VFYLRTPTAARRTRPTTTPARGSRPKFECSFAPTLVECQRQIQAYLDEWYADFNIVFTLTRPTSGKYYTEVVSSGGGAWCKVASNVAASRRSVQGPERRRRVHVPGRPQRARDGGDHRAGAGAPARARAHDNPHDIMYPTICNDTAAFVDDDSGVTAIAATATSRTRTSDDEEGAGRMGGRTQAVAVRLHGGHAGSSVPFLSPGHGAAQGP
jgi:hypothetical protein